MTIFSDIPQSVIDHVRSVFSKANNKVSLALSDHPSMHEEMLDQTLILELSTTPPAVFPGDQAAIVIESHWLGGRRMYGRWEIADIAILILLRRAGRLEQRKVALFQTKRLYSREISVVPIETGDYQIGIGRLGDRTDRSFPLVSQRTFSFTKECVYGAMHSGAIQPNHIDAYQAKTNIPVFYAFYNPVRLPYSALYPATNGEGAIPPIDLGCRVRTAQDVHNILKTLPAGQAPSFDSLYCQPHSSGSDAFAAAGWRLENFVADEVLRCRQGALFDGTDDSNLQRLFYERSAPHHGRYSCHNRFGRKRIPRAAILATIPTQ